MPVNAINLSTHVSCGVSTFVGVSPGAGGVAAVVVGCGGAINTRARSNVVVAWQGASSP